MNLVKNNHPIAVENINCFFHNDNVLTLSDRNIDTIFDSIYDNFLKEAVYPHLTEVSKNPSKKIKTKAKL